MEIGVPGPRKRTQPAKVRAPPPRSWNEKRIWKVFKPYVPPKQTQTSRWTKRYPTLRSNRGIKRWTSCSRIYETTPNQTHPRRTRRWRSTISSTAPSTAMSWTRKSPRRGGSTPVARWRIAPSGYPGTSTYSRSSWRSTLTCTPLSVKDCSIAFVKNRAKWGWPRTKSLATWVAVSWPVPKRMPNGRGASSFSGSIRNGIGRMENFKRTWVRNFLPMSFKKLKCWIKAREPIV